MRLDGRFSQCYYSPMPVSDGVSATLMLFRIRRVSLEQQIKDSDILGLQRLPPCSFSRAAPLQQHYLIKEPTKPHKINSISKARPVGTRLPLDSWRGSRRSGIRRFSIGKLL